MLTGELSAGVYAPGRNNNRVPAGRPELESRPSLDGRLYPVQTRRYNGIQNYRV